MIDHPFVADLEAAAMVARADHFCKISFSQNGMVLIIIYWFVFANNKWWMVYFYEFTSPLMHHFGRHSQIYRNHGKCYVKVLPVVFLMCCIFKSRAPDSSIRGPKRWRQLLSNSES